MTSRDEILEAYKHIPEIIENSIDMDNVNSNVTLFEGDYILKHGDQEIQIKGVIIFKWLPNSGVIFSGKSDLKIHELAKLTSQDNIYNIICHGYNIGEGFVNSSEFNNSMESTSISGVLKSQSILGDKSISVNKVKFSIPNLREFQGDIIKKITGDNILSLTGRLSFEDDKYYITIDKCHDYEEREKMLKNNGGYILQYHGEITPKKGTISFADLNDFLQCLNTYLTFLNGSRTSALFIQGIHDKEIIWCDYSSYYVDTYRSVQTWPQRLSIDGLNKLWCAFRKTWNEDKSFLKSSIHWYVEANRQSGSSEGSLIMAQTALELLYNWWIVERKKLITGKDSDGINASNKIRLLISQLNISHSIPAAFTSLQRFLSKNGDMNDAPDAIVQIRNAIIHSQEEKRKKLDEIKPIIFYEALQICVWYIEISLLRILGYNGKYRNRCFGAKWAGEDEKNVPWLEDSIY